MYCSTCGREVISNSNFCPNCGSALQTYLTAAPIRQTRSSTQQTNKLKRSVGLVMLWIGIPLSYIIQIGIGLYGIWMIIMSFVNYGVGIGILSIFIAGIVVTVLHFVLGLISIPFAALANYLIGDREQGR